jgi:hypothetical protein
MRVSFQSFVLYVVEFDDLARRRKAMPKLVNRTPNRIAVAGSGTAATALVLDAARAASGSADGS